MNLPVSHSGSDHAQTVKIYLLGKFEVSPGDQLLTAEVWPRKKTASLMKRLASDVGESQPGFRRGWASKCGVPHGICGDNANRRWLGGCDYLHFPATLSCHSSAI